VKPQTLRILGEGVTPPSSPVKAAKAGAGAGASAAAAILLACTAVAGGGASAATPVKTKKRKAEDAAKEPKKPKKPTTKATKCKLLGAHKDISGTTLAEIRASARKLRAAKDLRKIIELEGCTPRTTRNTKSDALRLRRQLDDIWDGMD
jgi:hypothetical protein